MATLIGMILVTSAVGFVFNHLVMPSPVLNFMLMGMAFSAAFSNMVTEERLEQIMQGFNPILGIAMIIVILNLGAPLDYHLILGAGMFTAIYIIVRAAVNILGHILERVLQNHLKVSKNILDLPFCRIQEYRLCLLELQCLY